MKQEIAEQWVAALRSGEYKQGHGKLCANGLHCCLAVLGEIAVKEGVIEKGPALHGAIQFDGSTMYLPAKVRDWAGMHSLNGRFAKGLTYSLAAANDEGGKTFAEIADLITAHAAEL